MTQFRHIGLTKFVLIKVPTKPSRPTTEQQQWSTDTFLGHIHIMSWQWHTQNNILLSLDLFATSPEVNK